MPFFRYAATDSQGKALQGTVQAASSDAAEKALAERGIRVTTWLDPSARHAIPASSSARSQSGPTARSPQANVVSRAPRTTPESPANIRIHPSAPSRPDLEPRRTRRGSDKERFFLFTQISNFLRAGINPHQAFGDMAARIRKEDYREAMQKVAQLAAEGVPISAVLAAYPDLFPGHVVGLVRAGETGGFLPEACTAVAQQAEAAHKFRRSLWMIWVVMINLVLVVPVAYLFYRGVPRAYEITEATGAQGISGGLAAFRDAFWELIKWPIGPVALTIYALAAAAYLWLNSRPMSPKRHGMSLATPILGGRAKNEGLSLFSWVLSRVAQSGTSPQQSWGLGVASVPNLALKAKLETAGERLHSGERLSVAFFESRLFPDEYAPMMSTAEMTGDVPGTLQKLSDIGRHEFELSTSKSKTAAWVLTSTAAVVTMGIIVIFLALTLYVKLPETVLRGLEPP